MGKSHVLKANRKPKISSRAYDPGIPERPRGGRVKKTSEAAEEEKKKAYKRPRPGRPVHFNDTQKREYINGFAKRKQERREKAAAQAKEEEIAQRKEIKQAHQETIEEQYQDALKASKVSEENVERAAEMKRIAAKAKKLELKQQAGGGDIYVESEEESSGSQVDMGIVEEIESILPPVQVLESSDEEDGGKYTVETSFNLEEEPQKKKGRTTLADLGIELTIRQKERIQKQINSRKREEVRKDAKKKKKYKGAKYDKMHKKKAAGAKRKTLSKASKKKKK